VGDRPDAEARRGRARIRALVTALPWLIPAILLVIASAAYSVQVDQPRIVVRWAPSADAEARSAVAAAARLVYRRAIERDGVNDADSFLPIEPGDQVLPRLRQLPEVASAEIEGAADAPLTPRVSIALAPSYVWFLEWQVQSSVLMLAAIALIAGSMASRRPVRIAIAIACTAAIGIAGLTLPLDARIHMGDSEQYTASRQGFENVFPADMVGFESHLSSQLVWWLDRAFGQNDVSAAAALAVLSRAATMAFVAMLLGVGMLERFSPAALRYLALAIAAPASLMYFGYRELGYLSLSPAVFPLIVHGLRGLRGRLEAGALLAGLGAAFHGFGILSIAGSGAAAFVTRAPLDERAWRLGRVAAFATAAYLGWILIYVAVLHVSINPSDAGEIPWRSLSETVIQGTYVKWAVLSVRGLIEIAAASWMVGVPLALAAAAAAIEGHVSRQAWLFAAPSILFLCFIWPIQGLAVEADLLVAAFPAIYALAWVAAQSSRATMLGLVLLAGSHVVFWRVLFSDAFVASRL
jgi:hypothetical protein